MIQEEVVRYTCIAIAGVHYVIQRGFTISTYRIVDDIPIFKLLLLMLLLALVVEKGCRTFEETHPTTNFCVQKRRRSR
jgi:hypothetical protein